MEEIEAKAKAEEYKLLLATLREEVMLDMETKITAAVKKQKKTFKNVNAPVISFEGE